MPQTIRQTLFNRLRESELLAEMKKDLEALLGIRLRLVGPGARGADADQACVESPFCERVRENWKGCEHCRKFHETVASRTGERGIGEMQCDGGMTEFAVALKTGGETLGYLLAGGYRVGELDRSGANRLRHLMGRMGVRGNPQEWDILGGTARQLNEDQHEALKRWVVRAAESLMRSMEFREVDPDRPLPGFVRKICAVIQNRYKSPPSLEEAAAHCGLSKGYFCRAFHESTGLRYVEYIHAVRTEKFCELLKDAEISITEAAFAVGFQSLSQFNRVFRKQRGVSPRDWRRQNMTSPNRAISR